MARYRKVRVGKSELRRRFREAGLEEPEQNGYTVHLGSSGPAGPGGPPDCSSEEILIYYDSIGNPVARAHQYKRPDGSIGASGRPDPIRLRDGDTIYIRRVG